jgi:hypothetical protein
VGKWVGFSVGCLADAWMLLAAAALAALALVPTLEFPPLQLLLLLLPLPLPRCR